MEASAGWTEFLSKSRAQHTEGENAKKNRAKWSPQQTFFVSKILRRVLLWNLHLFCLSVELRYHRGDRHDVTTGLQEFPDDKDVNISIHCLHYQKCLLAVFHRASSTKRKETLGDTTRLRALAVFNSMHLTKWNLYILFLLCVAVSSCKEIYDKKLWVTVRHLKYLTSASINLRPRDDTYWYSYHLEKELCSGSLCKSHINLKRLDFEPSYFCYVCFSYGLRGHLKFSSWLINLLGSFDILNSTIKHGNVTKKPNKNYCSSHIILISI